MFLYGTYFYYYTVVNSEKIFRVVWSIKFHNIECINQSHNSINSVWMSIETSTSNVYKYVCCSTCHFVIWAMRTSCSPLRKWHLVVDCKNNKWWDTCVNHNKGSSPFRVQTVALSFLFFFFFKFWSMIQQYLDTSLCTYNEIGKKSW